ncbi:hypothetical protein JB92DRAFT_1293182 [Gautieria morchelliformis]|nr:hypothetical protein JB92DRAFT_1293182 [Gautieria morchelliformis]
MRAEYARPTPPHPLTSPLSQSSAPRHPTFRHPAADSDSYGRRLSSPRRQSSRPRRRPQSPGVAFLTAWQPGLQGPTELVCPTCTCPQYKHASGHAEAPRKPTRTGPARAAVASAHRNPPTSQSSAPRRSTLRHPAVHGAAADAASRGYNIPTASAHTQVTQVIFEYTPVPTPVLRTSSPTDPALPTHVHIAGLPPSPSSARCSCGRRLSHPTPCDVPDTGPAPPRGSQSSGIPTRAASRADVDVPARPQVVSSTNTRPGRQDDQALPYAYVYAQSGTYGRRRRRRSTPARRDTTRGSVFDPRDLRTALSRRGA